MTISNSAIVSSGWAGSINTECDIPVHADVIIIGGGIIGVSTVYYLAKKGTSVTLCEKGHIAGEQSSRNWGWMRLKRPVVSLSFDERRVWVQHYSFSTSLFN